MAERERLGTPERGTAARLFVAAALFCALLGASFFGTRTLAGASSAHPNYPLGHLELRVPVQGVVAK
ncbi:MAG: hypothetical protein WB770_02000 [Acidimicrobiales bacterium]